MNDDTKLEFENLELAFVKVLSVCNPMEFQVRLKELLLEIDLVHSKHYRDAIIVEDCE